MEEVLISKQSRQIVRKFRILRLAEKIDHVAETCRFFGVGRGSLYRWSEAYRKHGNDVPLQAPDRLQINLQRDNNAFGH